MKRTAKFLLAAVFLSLTFASCIKWGEETHTTTTETHYTTFYDVEDAGTCSGLCAQVDKYSSQYDPSTGVCNCY